MTEHADDLLDDNPAWDATNTRPLDTPSAQLRAARAVLGLTQAGMADLLGVPIATLRNWEQARTAPDGRLALFHGPRCIARYQADGQPDDNTEIAA